MDTSSSYTALGVSSSPPPRSRGRGLVWRLPLLSLLLLLLVSCSSEKDIRDYKRRDRDARIVGIWLHWDEQTKSDKSPAYQYASDGTLHIIHYSHDVVPRVKYYYTQDRELYVLTPGQGIKVSARTDRYTYRISDDGQWLYLTRGSETNVYHKQKP